jgi:hypothetical protein
VHRCHVFQSGRTAVIVGGCRVCPVPIVFKRFDLDQEHLIGPSPSCGMKSNDEKQRKEEPPPRDVESRRKVLEEYIADLRAFLDRLRRMLN